MREEPRLCFGSPGGKRKASFRMAGFAGGTCSGASGFDASGGELEVGKAKLRATCYGLCGNGRPAVLLPRAGAQATQAGARGGAMEPAALQPLCLPGSRKVLGCHSEPEGSSLASFSAAKASATKKAGPEMCLEVLPWRIAAISCAQLPSQPGQGLQLGKG